MTMSYSILPDQRLVVARCFGLVDDSDGLTYMRALRSDPAFDPTFDEITDCTEITDNQVTMEGLKDVATSSAFDPTARHAIIVARNLEMGRGRQFSMLASADADLYHVTESVDDAIAWLGAPAPGDVARAMAALREG